jgi:putative ATP-dependent endonuclease of OLD family
MHPYMQRNLIKTIDKLITNQDINFNEFIKNNLGIDVIIGQSIIVTHSPNILLNDYRQYLRLCFSNLSQVNTVSGYEIDLDDGAKKHLYKQIQYIREAFFSRVAIIVEGDTEYGAFQEWIEKSGIDMDRNGIIVIKADGKKSINYLRELLEKFGIKSYTFADRDDNQNNNFDFITYGKDLEEDVVNELFNFSEEEEDKKRNVVYDILEEIMPAEFTKEQRKHRIKTLDRNKTLEKLKKFKSITTGKIIGQKIPLEYIPPSVKNFINKLKHDLLVEDE